MPCHGFRRLHFAQSELPIFHTRDHAKKPLGCNDQVADAAQPSYDCTKAKLSDELAACGNERLAELDVILTFGFKYLKTHIGKEAASALARTFLKERQACGDNMECIRAAYIAANLEYQKNGAPILVPAWGFRPIGRNPVTVQGGVDEVPSGGTAASVSPSDIAPTLTETSVPPASAAEVRGVSTQPSYNAATAEVGQDRRLCQYTMGQMQRYDGKPHSMADCEADPDAYREKIGDDNRRIVAEHKAQGKSIDNLPDSRPLEGRMISWQGEIEAFRLDQSFPSVDAVMTTLDIFDTWGTTLMDFSRVASIDGERQRLANLRTTTEAKLRQLFPVLRQTLGCNSRRSSGLITSL
jgi:hypothetical protein